MLIYHWTIFVGLFVCLIILILFFIVHISQAINYDYYLLRQILKWYFMTMSLINYSKRCSTLSFTCSQIYGTCSTLELLKTFYCTYLCSSLFTPFLHTNDSFFARFCYSPAFAKWKVKILFGHWVYASFDYFLYDVWEDCNKNEQNNNPKWTTNEQKKISKLLFSTYAKSHIWMDDSVEVSSA